MAANGTGLVFSRLSGAGLRQWVESNPGLVNDRDSSGETPLIAAVALQSVSLIKWLVNEKGADVHAADKHGYAPLHFADSLDAFNALLDCGADPSLCNPAGRTVLLTLLMCRRNDLVARLLQDPRQAIVNAQVGFGASALHLVCNYVDKPGTPDMIPLLLQAGADITLEDARGETPLMVLQRVHPSHPTTLALLEQISNTEKASFLIKTRRLVVAATHNSTSTAPSFVQDRVARGLPLPHAAMSPVMTDGQSNDEDEEEAMLKLRTALAFLVGVERGSVPRGGGACSGWCWTC